MFKITIKPSAVIISKGNCSIVIDNKKGLVVSGLDTLEQKEHTFIKRIETFFLGYTNIYKNEFDALAEICQDASDSKSWRNFSNAIRKNANIYLVSNGVTTNAEFQGKFFYEGTMSGRTIHGANAPWIGSNAEPITKNKAPYSSKSEPKIVDSISTYKPYNWDLNQEWDQKNKAIADRIAG